MTTPGNFEFVEDENATTRNHQQLKEMLPEFINGRNFNPNGKKSPEMLPVYGTKLKGSLPRPIDSMNSGKHPISDYDDSEGGPIYQQAGDGGREWRRKDSMASISKVIGIRDICGNKGLWRMLIAEFIGTAFLVLIGCGSCLKGWSPTYVPGVLQIAFAFGLTVASLAQAIGHISGCHVNPAVTIGLIASNKCSILKGIAYIIFQCLGAICGSAILQAITPVEIQGNLGMTLLHEKMDPVQGMFVEALITFVLVLTVCGVCDDLRKDIKGSAPLAIGLSITVCHLMAINYTGSSMNPARTLGPSVITKIWTNHWIYWAGPILGGICAGFIYQVTFRERAAVDDKRS